MATKNDQIIIRLSEDKKKRLQEIADSMGIDMSKLIRNEIDQIITMYDEKDKFKKMVMSNMKDSESIQELNNHLIDIQNQFQMLSMYIRNNIKK